MATRRFDVAGPPPLAAALQALLAELELAPAACGALRLVGDDPVFASPLRLGGAMAVAALAAGAASAALGQARGLPCQDVTVAVHEAARNLFPELNHAPRLNGRKFAQGSRSPAFLLGIYRSADQRFFVPSALSAAERLRWAEALRCPAVAAADVAPEVLQAACAPYTGAWLEDCAAANNLAGVCCQTPASWAEHPHGVHLLRQPVLQRQPATTTATPKARLLGAATRPLAGVRVLVFGRVFAGPLVGRVLAEQGAQVLHIGSAQRPEHAGVYMEGFVGGRSAHCTLRDPADRAQVQKLARQADVVVDNTRPNSLLGYGLDAATLLQQNPQLVHLRIDAFGSDGPWGNRAGYDMNAVAAAGLLRLDASLQPQFLPSVLLADFVAGYLGAAGVATALYEREAGMPAAQVRRAITLNLCRTASWCGQLGRLPTGGGPDRCWLPRQQTFATALGQLRRLAPAAQFSHTPASWPEPVLGVQGSARLGW